MVGQLSHLLVKIWRPGKIGDGRIDAAPEILKNHGVILSAGMAQVQATILCSGKAFCGRARKGLVLDDDPPASPGSRSCGARAEGPSTAQRRRTAAEFARGFGGGPGDRDESRCLLIQGRWIFRRYLKFEYSEAMSRWLSKFIEGKSSAELQITGCRFQRRAVRPTQ